MIKFDENCPKRKPSNSQVHVHAVITFQFEKTHKTIPWTEFSRKKRTWISIVLQDIFWTSTYFSQRSLKALYFSRDNLSFIIKTSYRSFFHYPSSYIYNNLLLEHFYKLYYSAMKWFTSVLEFEDFHPKLLFQIPEKILIMKKSHGNIINCQLMTKARSVNADLHNNFTSKFFCI